MKFTDEEVKIFNEEMKAIGMELIDAKDIEGNYGMGLEVDIDTSVDYTDIVESGLIMRKNTKRNDFFYVVVKSYNKETEKLTLLFSTPLSEKAFNYYSQSVSDYKMVGTSFPDLCWYHAEGTNANNVDELETKFREDAELGDLTWFLPTRVTDNFIEVMHTLNQSFLEGLMQEAFIYGPYIYKDSEE